MTSHAKKMAAMALLVAVTLSTVPVKSAFADVTSATNTFMGVDIRVDDIRDFLASGPFTEDPGMTIAPTSTRVTVIKKHPLVAMTAYTSRPEETDDTPFITADGSHVRDGIVACNFLPFGTKVRVPALFGDKVFEVHDRMNKRFSYKMDFWMEGYHEAIQFGIRRADIEIVKVEEVDTTGQVVNIAMTKEVAKAK
jgi:3D (Asp-Asp-Asp) domain-containing protein